MRSYSRISKVQFQFPRPLFTSQDTFLHYYLFWSPAHKYCECICISLVVAWLLYCIHNWFICIIITLISTLISLILITQKHAKESQLILFVLIYFPTNGLLVGETFLWIILSIASAQVHVSHQTHFVKIHLQHLECLKPKNQVFFGFLFLMHQ